MRTAAALLLLCGGGAPPRRAGLRRRHRQSSAADGVRQFSRRQARAAAITQIIYVLQQQPSVDYTGAVGYTDANGGN